MLSFHIGHCCLKASSSHPGSIFRLIPGVLDKMSKLDYMSKLDKWESERLLSWLNGKELACQCRRLKEEWVWSLSLEHPLEENVATHSSIFAWKIPWTEEPSRPQSMVLQRVRHTLATEHAHDGKQRTIINPIFFSYVFHLLPAPKLEDPLSQISHLSLLVHNVRPCNIFL